MDWMYRGVSGLVDREEYLTGRKIDKTFEIIQNEEQPTKGDLDAFEPQIPGSVLDSNQSTSSLVTIDLAAKLREDPLYEIRVKQREQRKKLLDNPLKLKKLKTILESTLKEDKHNRHKKKKKRRHGNSSSSGGDSSDSYSDNKSDPKRHRNQHKSDHKNSRHSDDKRDERRHKNNELNRDRDPHKRDYHRKYEQKLKDFKSYDIKTDRRIEKRFDVKQQNNSKRLSAEELEKKRKEMVENAVWRECQRKSNVKSYEDEEMAENKFNSSAKSAQFIKPLLKSATESDSLEDRIKQKRFRSQRGYDTMDKNFAKK